MLAYVAETHKAYTTSTKKGKAKKGKSKTIYNHVVALHVSVRILWSAENVIN